MNQTDKQDFQVRLPIRLGQTDWVTYITAFYLTLTEWQMMHLPLQMYVANHVHMT